MKVYARTPGSSEYVGPLLLAELRERIGRGELAQNVQVLEATGQSRFEIDQSPNWTPAAPLLGLDYVPSEHAIPPQPEPEPLPALTVLFRVVAAMEMIGGTLFCVQLWPGEPRAGYDWTTIAYVPALTWLSAGFIFGLLFWAIGDGLLYLRDIRRILLGERPPQSPPAA